jgi:hypothetical protein
MKRILTAALAAASLSVVACDDITSNTDAAEVTLGFSTTSTSTSALSADVSASVIAADAHELVLTGDNGTLTITDIAFIVDEFKLERDGAPCEELEGEAEQDDCETFETGLAFVDLPLDGETVPVVTQVVPAGTYVFLKLETDDADLDEAADDAEAAEIVSLMAAIEGAGYTDWPANASLVVAGSFAPAEGEPRAFTAFFEGEVKVELAFDPALVIDGESGTVDIEIDPAAWYTDGAFVIDLSAYDFATTGEVVEFEAKMADGFKKVELEGFND